jgi:protein-S-isoprenylcysteine O-methyltransferase Ste14
MRDGNAEGVGPMGPADSSGVRIFPPLIYAGGLVAGFLLQLVWPLGFSAGSWTPLIRLAGILMVVAGLLLVLWATGKFHEAGTPANPRKPTTALVLSGPYRFSRNPMYLGLTLVQAGIALLTDALWPLITLIPVLWIVRREVIEREENYLAAKFGEVYLKYKASVRRWI